ncbi:lysylphosphatidylglycerol synthase transmembrane domain-containing protein [Lacticaseibacillus daqingensis]|uniref:lysylphosphatidylglycerol synthase transmembrane domain-containing protein n=1 Tax=Lacticaseibacillus daqingensis TaxID=2486014 RepID=UPI000F79CA45|nr:lysylphosphatidylglycerol synthase transmembrane domain-containing protein [Lacticaseibacillus daqingensis]
MSRRNKWAALLMVLIGAGIFAFEMRHQNLAQVAHTLQHLELGWLAVAVAVMCLSWLVETVVVQIFVQHDGDRLPFSAALRVPLVEQLFNNITPFASGGQPAQLVALMQAGVEGGRASSILLMKFIVYQFMVLLNFILTIALGFHQIVAQFGALALLIVFGFVIHVTVIIGLLLVMYHYRFTKRLVGWGVNVFGWFAKPARKAALQLKLDAKIDTFYAESLHLKREKRKVLKAALLTLVQLFLYYSVPYFVLRCFGIADVSFVEVLILHIMIVMIVSLFPIPGGTGGAEYSFKTLFAAYVPLASQLVLAMLLWRLLTYYLGMALGAVALGVSPRRIEHKARPDK